METLLLTISGAIFLVLLIFFMALIWEELADFMKKYWHEEEKNKLFTNRIFKRFLSFRH